MEFIFGEFIWRELMILQNNLVALLALYHQQYMKNSNTIKFF